MKCFGITRSVDKLGRFVIPKEIRRTLGLAKGTPLLICVDGERIVLTKTVPMCAVCGAQENLMFLQDEYLCEKCRGTVLK